MSTVNIVLVSDNHGRHESLKKLKEMYPDYDLFVHLGDSEAEVSEMDGYVCVKGNNDFAYYNDIPYQMTLSIKGHRILVTHGHLILRSYFDHSPLAQRAKAEGADVVLYGHTHMPCDEVIDGVRLLNPGSVTQNRDGSAPSYMLLHISEDEVTAEKMEYRQSSGGQIGLFEKIMQYLMGGKEK